MKEDLRALGLGAGLLLLAWMWSPRFRSDVETFANWFIKRLERI
jgi:hypothetical protein